MFSCYGTCMVFLLRICISYLCWFILRIDACRIEPIVTYCMHLNNHETIHGIMIINQQLYDIQYGRAVSYDTMHTHDHLIFELIGVGWRALYDGRLLPGYVMTNKGRIFQIVNGRLENVTEIKTIYRTKIEWCISYREYCFILKTPKQDCSVFIPEEGILEWWNHDQNYSHKFEVNLKFSIYSEVVVQTNLPIHLVYVIYQYV